MTLGKSDSRTRISAGSTERAVSPVIGVILMVAITVILAAVIGVFVMGLGEDVGDSAAPTASLSFEAGDEAENISISHNSGDPLDLGDGDFTILVDGDADGDHHENATSISAGESIQVNVSASGPTDIALRHEPSESILHEEEVDI